MTAIRIRRRSLLIAPYSLLRGRAHLPLPRSLLARLRLLTLGLAVASALATLPPLLAAHRSAWLTVAGALASVALSAHWVAGYRRGSFPLIGEAFEVGAVFLLLEIVPGNPLLPLLGLVFRSLYGGVALTWLRYATWMGALLVAHSTRGATQLNADAARAVAVALVPCLLPLLRHSITRLETSERRMASLVQNSTDIVTVVDRDLVIRWQAESIATVLGFRAADLLGTHLDAIVHVEDRERIASFLSDAEEVPGLTRTLALRLHHNDGDVRHFEVVIADRSRDDAVSGFVLNMRDATQRLRLEHDLVALADQREHDALHDPLTGLPNRRSLFAALGSALALAGAEERQLALLLIDLDRFKELNDTLGHHVGDELLRQFRPRLSGLVAGRGMLARLGGDEFAVLMDPGTTPEEAIDMAQRLRAATARPFAYEGMTLLVEASVGIAIYPDHAADAETLLQRADIAMYAAKRESTGQQMYRFKDDGHSRDGLALLGELPRALASAELVVHYQPKFDLVTGEIRGVESLVRWQHPKRGLLYPPAFLPLIEHTGLMRPLTLAILDASLAQAAEWQQLGLWIPVAINLSVPDLVDDSLAADVADRLAARRIDASLLKVEIPERIIAADPDRIAGTLARLRELGVAVSLDDFGTGSSSLSYLRRLPVQELKVDKSFVQAAATGDPADQAIVRTVVALARDLGLVSVAEGIETSADLDLLRRLGCDQGQGYGLGRPMDAEGIIALARAHGTAPIPQAVLVS